MVLMVMVLMKVMVVVLVGDGDSGDDHGGCDGDGGDDHGGDEYDKQYTLFEDPCCVPDMVLGIITTPLELTCPTSRDQEYSCPLHFRVCVHLF